MYVNTAKALLAVDSDGWDTTTQWLLAECAHHYPAVFARTPLRHTPVHTPAQRAPRAVPVSRVLEHKGAVLMDSKRARKLWHSLRVLRGDCGVSEGLALLTPPEGNRKLELNTLPSYSVTLSEAATSGWDVCAHSTPQCRAACVMHGGAWGGKQHARAARDARVQFLLSCTDAFYTVVASELQRAVNRYGKVACRLNAASDIRHERIAPWLFDMFADTVTFYDYTKYPRSARGNLPRNYTLTYSRSEKWDVQRVQRYTAAGENVAVVFATPKHALPVVWQGMRVVDGDISDARYSDPRGVVVGLAAKGDGKGLPGGFVVHPIINAYGEAI